MSQAMSRKQELLKRHRRNKRVGVADRADHCRLLHGCAGCLVAAMVFAVLGWVAHEAWFSDHLFYSPKDDYQYSFPPHAAVPKVTLERRTPAPRRWRDVGRRRDAGAGVADQKHLVGALFSIPWSS
jgi:hypothetical protein